MQNVTVDFIAKECGFKDAAYVRQLLSAGKLEGSKPDGKAWAIDLDLPKNREFFNKNRKNTASNTVTNTVNTQEIPTKNTVELPKEDTQLIRDLFAEVKQLSFEAGRVAQLSDNLKQKETDVEYWKTQYFELQNKYERLLKENTELKPALKSTLLEIEALKARKWWQLK